jgi:hypothetical protein
MILIAGVMHSEILFTAGGKPVIEKWQNWIYIQEKFFY